ncbi:MAG: hypothetical protein A2W90_14475 [Bacteroidetes bacterium GWF2_42_66]|nr:MAG: hypothetical protein A2W92_15870 [Bacteroidetes bacterium GWA2_42_15]OFX99099.1 MAG: hypothetical protein A2W89_06785 [Bacteroidetes bacterium GWE2_42_39]OFY46732.1 MAG: hypothetical protein A2W90_14475 [Bacteroidetes bacterium GWF2_42_66]HAZ00678.1 hypothetical protein [Marinilabiliales bacterium]HBL73862.1 hypothetical protein [Prolixibacteraceae bacterium]
MKRYNLKCRIVISSHSKELNEVAIGFLLKHAEMIQIATQLKRSVTLPFEEEDQSFADVVFYEKKGLSLFSKRALYNQIKGAAYLISVSGFYNMALPQQHPYKVVV